MKNLLPLFCLAILLTAGCSRGIVRKDVTVSWDKNSLAYNYEVFRSNRGRIIRMPYMVTNADFLTAMSNEFAFYNLSREQSLNDAIAGYSRLTNVFTNETGFLYQRIGICFFKNRNLPEANKYVNLAVLENTRNSELSFYKAMLLAYHSRDPVLARKWLKEVDLAAVYIQKQDLLAFEASLYDAESDYKKADEIYHRAIIADPQRFYQNYDLTYFYDHARMKAEQDNYLRLSSSLLSSGNIQKPFRVKGYRQLVNLNRMNRMETLEYRYGFSDGFEYYPSILYYCQSPRPIDRIISFYLQIPVKDKRSYSSEKIYYPVFEDNIDLKTNSMILLGESMLSIDGMTHPFYANSARISKIIGTNSVAMVLSPSNIYLIVTNASLPTNSRDYVVSNQSNLISMKTQGFVYYMDTEYCDIDGNSVWDYLFFGFDKTNRSVVTIFQPDRMAWKTLRFNLKKPDAEFVVQDVNHDGRKEMLLLDDDVYFLSPEALP